MVTTYIPKTPIMNSNRIQRIAKKLIEEAGEDRQLALETHRFFREMVDENPQDAAAKNLLVDCLKVAQASKNNVIKVLNLLVKMEESSDVGDMTKYSTNSKGKTIFSELDNLTDG